MTSQQSCFVGRLSKKKADPNYRQLFFHGHLVTILVTALTTPNNCTNDPFIFSSIEKHKLLAVANDAISRQEIFIMLYCQFFIISYLYAVYFNTPLRK